MSVVTGRRRILPYIKHGILFTFTKGFCLLVLRILILMRLDTNQEIIIYMYNLYIHDWHVFS